MDKVNISHNAGIYIHVPFCDTKCGYCDFYSITNQNLRPQFVDALLKEIGQYAAPPFDGLLYDTIYFGGGTPSLLTTAELERILAALHVNFKISPDCETTLEANPGTLSAEKARSFKKLGINRVSMGIQSFDDAELKTLGRIHNAQQARSAFDDLRRAGIENISIDLIFALPGQSHAQWKKNLAKGIELQPEHISAYNLIYEQGTPFFKKLQKGQFRSFSDSDELIFYNETLDMLRQAGYVRYEVSNYAKNESLYSRHNYKYWNHAPFLGLGPAAYAYQGGKRWGNVRSIKKYIRELEADQLPVDFEEKLDRRTLGFEKIMLGLRTKEGVNLKEFETFMGQELLQVYAKQIPALLKDGLAQLDDGHFYFTDKGFLLCDSILPAFAPD